MRNLFINPRPALRARARARLARPRNPIHPSIHPNGCPVAMASHCPPPPPPDRMGARVQDAAAEKAWGAVLATLLTRGCERACIPAPTPARPTPVRLMLDRSPFARRPALIRAPAPSICARVSRSPVPRGWLHGKTEKQRHLLGNLLIPLAANTHTRTHTLRHAIIM